MLHEYKNEIHELKQSNAHFAKVFEKHNELDKKVEDAEADRIILTDVELETLKKDLMAYLNKNGEISTTGLKDLTQASRKYTIPLMEYCDQSKITIRVGDKRMLRDKKG